MRNVLPLPNVGEVAALFAPGEGDVCAPGEGDVFALCEENVSAAGKEDFKQIIFSF